MSEHRLAPREIEYLELAQSNLSDEEIADEMDIEEGTVRVMRSRISDKEERALRTLAKLRELEFEA